MLTKDSQTEEFGSFSNKFTTDEYYDKSLGWKHSGLIKILGEYNLKPKKKKYVSTRKIIADLISSEKPAIISLFVPSPNNISPKGYFRKNDCEESNERHLVVLKGYKNKRIIINDPRNIFHYGEDSEIPISEFNKVFTGDIIQV
jgi:hypothetical protein